MKDSWRRESRNFFEQNSSRAAKNPQKFFVDKISETHFISALGGFFSADKWNPSGELQ